MTQTAFDRALVWLLHGGHGWHGEAGISTDPTDHAAQFVAPGDVHTVDGITQPAYDDFRLAGGETPRPVAGIEPAEVGALYFRLWRRAWCDRLAALPAEALALCVFDAVVQHGEHPAVTLWQRTVHSPADAVPGPRTLADTQKRINGIGELALAEAYLERRYGFYQQDLMNHPDQGRFARGWQHRLNALCAQLGIPPVWPGLD